MPVFETLELGLNELHDEVCALYIKRQYNLTVVEDFIRDKTVCAIKAATMKERMMTSVKEI
jgi:hypothetical protein